MSVYFYCTAWGFSKTPKTLDAITNEQLVEMAIAPGSSPDEGQAWLTEARRMRAGKIESKGQYKIKLYAGEGRGQCLYPDEVSEMHPDVMFVEISGADCTQEESIALIKGGVVMLHYYGVVPYNHEFFQIVEQSDDETTYDKVEKSFDDLYHKMTSKDNEDAILQQDPEE